jgi:hypothetical protein
MKENIATVAAPRDRAAHVARAGKSATAHVENTIAELSSYLIRASERKSETTRSAEERAFQAGMEEALALALSFLRGER